MTYVLRGPGCSGSDTLHRWRQDYASGRYTAVVEAWSSARSALPPTWSADFGAVEAVGWSLALTKQWDGYALFRQDLLASGCSGPNEALLGILDSWRAIHDARYDASLVGTRNVQTHLLDHAASRLLAYALKVESVALFRLGRYGEAETIARRALELFRAAGDRLNAAQCATNLGLVLNARGEIRAAREELRRALAEQLDAGVADERLALARENLAVVEVHLGNAVEAQGLYESALETFRRLGLRSEQVTALNGLGHCARLLGRFEVARECFESALALATPDMPRQIGLCHEFLGQIAFDVGAEERAETHYRAALETAAAIAPDGDLMVESSWRYAELLAVQGRVEECRVLVERAEALCARSADRRELGCVLRARARLQAATGALDGARADFLAAGTTLEASGRPFEAALTLLAHAEVEQRAGNRSAAATLLEATRSRLAELVPESLWPQQLDAGFRGLRPASGDMGRYGFVTGDPAMLDLLGDLPGIAATPHPVLLEGESGTGKELLARALHDLGERTGPFVAVNCSAIPRDLFESELFGHARGAYSGASSAKPGLLEQAAGGTLLLDEIGEMPLELQAKLLRVLDDGIVRRIGEIQEHRVQVKIVAATNRPLLQIIEAGRFRRDLYHRLAVHHLHLMPLRDRPGDVELLARHFLAREKLTERLVLTPEILAGLEARDWLGNARELRNELIRRATQRAGGNGVPGLPSAAGETGAVSVPAARSLRESRHVHERRLIEAAVQEASGNLTAAARGLGMHVTTLRRKMHRLGVRRPD